MPYVTLWTRVVSVVAVTALLLALAMGRPLGVILALACVYAVAALVLAACRHDRSGGVPLDWREIRGQATVLACVLVGLPAAVQISAGATMIIVLVSLGTAPALVARAEGHARRIAHWQDDVSARSRSGSGIPLRGPDPVTMLLELGPTAGRVASLDTPTLCLAWRRSFQMLSAASTPAERSVVANLRQLYLDELDSRYPSSVASWLASFPSPASGPDGYLPET